MKNWKFHNWRTSLATAISLLGYAAAHQTNIVPLLPEKYRPLGTAVFVLAGIVAGLCQKDAGNHSAAPPADPPTTPSTPDPAANG
jgi:hypothetical protein